MAASSFKQTVLSWPISSRRKSANVRHTDSVVSEFIRHKDVDYNEDLEIIQHLKNRRSRALASLTRKKNQIEPLLVPGNMENLPSVRSKMEEYVAAFNKFCELNDAYDNVIHDGDAKTESFMYFVDVKKTYLEFCQKVRLWATSLPDASVSQSASSSGSETSSESSKTKSKSQIPPEDRRSTSQSTSSSSKQSLSGRIAELEARQASLQQRKELHEKELRLKEEKLKLELERENIELEEELRSLKAKDEASSRKSSRVSKHKNTKPKSSVKSSPEPKRSEKHLVPPEFYINSSTPLQDKVVEQQNKIWNEIVLQQQRATLPKQEVPKFTGDPLDYHTFIRAFDTLIASREPDFSSKLYYLEQYTAGRPQELVKSCLHMKPKEGYYKARELLEQRFGEKSK